MILGIRTDKPEAELYLLDASGQTVIEDIWTADRQLSNQLNERIESLLHQAGISYADLSGLVVFAGPGSFTGLRIGIAIANTLAYGLNLPIAAAGGSDWLKSAVVKLSQTEPAVQVLPEYGGEANITKPKK